EHVPGPGRDGEQRVVAPDPGVPVVEGTLLRQAVRLADRRVEIDRQRSRARSGAGCPGAGQELPTDAVELADMAPAEAAQERAERRGGLEGDAEHALGAARPEGGRVVDAVTTGEGREHQGRELAADGRPARRRPEVEVLVDQLAQAEMLGQGGWQE